MKPTRDEIAAPAGDQGLAQRPNAAVRTFMFVNRKAPYGSVYAAEGLDVVLAAAAFDQQVCLAFLDDGVYQLVKGQDPEAIGAASVARAYRALEDYEVDKLYVERESLELRGLTAESLGVPAIVLPAAELSRLMDAADLLISF